MTAALRMLVLLLLTLLHLQSCCTKYLLLNMDTGNKSDHVSRRSNKALTPHDEGLTFIKIVTLHTWPLINLILRILRLAVVLVG